MYKRTQSAAALKISSNEGVGQTKADALVCVCPRLRGAQGQDLQLIDIIPTPQGFSSPCV